MFGGVDLFVWIFCCKLGICFIILIVFCISFWLLLLKFVLKIGVRMCVCGYDFELGCLLWFLVRILVKDFNKFFLFVLLDFRDGLYICCKFFWVFNFIFLFCMKLNVFWDFLCCGSDWKVVIGFVLVLWSLFIDLGLWGDLFL